jgi:hypothetical protein
MGVVTQMVGRENQNKLDVLSRRFRGDSEYTKRFFSDFEFAKMESSKVGLEMTAALYSALSLSYSKLTNFPERSQTFENKWYAPSYKYHYPGRRKLVVALAMISLAASGISAFMILRRSSNDKS